MALFHLETSGFLSVDEGGGWSCPCCISRSLQSPVGQRQMCSSKVLPVSLSAKARISVSLL